MAKHPKRPRDPNQLAKLIADIATGDAENDNADPSPMAQRGRQGGLRGGKSRADKLSPERRAEIAKKGADKRWGR